MNQNGAITIYLMRQELVGRKLRGCCYCKKKEIETLLARHREEIETGKLKVLLLDECHLMWSSSWKKPNSPSLWYSSSVKRLA